MATGLLNPTHIILLLLVALIILEPKPLPRARWSIGRGMREFKESITGQEDTPEQTQVYTPQPLRVQSRKPRQRAPATATAQQPVIPRTPVPRPP
jgi:sec-independent protein translocase protein TatA